MLMDKIKMEPLRDNYTIVGDYDTFYLPALE
jgi:hypothetical protein